MKPLYIYFLAASLACTSCSDSWLDLNPSTSVPTDQAFSSLEDAQSALNGIYRLASAHSIMVTISFILAIAGLRMCRLV